MTSTLRALVLVLGVKKREKERGTRTQDVDFIGVALEASGVVLNHVASLEDALDGAGLDVELVVAEAVSSVQKLELVTIRDAEKERIKANLSSGEKFQSVTAP